MTLGSHITEKCRKKNLRSKVIHRARAYKRKSDTFLPLSHAEMVVCLPHPSPGNWRLFSVYHTLAFKIFTVSSQPNWSTAGMCELVVRPSNVDFRHILEALLKCGQTGLQLGWWEVWETIWKVSNQNRIVSRSDGVKIEKSVIGEWWLWLATSRLDTSDE